MKITIIYGNQRKGSTYHCVKIIKDTFLVYEDVTFTEFFLPRDMPHFCLGCFNCFFTGELNCPHYEHVLSIVDALLNSDAIILSSPTYGFNVTGSMKALIDHLCYMWMSHRPNEKMCCHAGIDHCRFGNRKHAQNDEKYGEFYGNKTYLFLWGGSGSSKLAGGKTG